LARKILLADDSVTAQNMGRKILSDAGYDVVTVNNGSAALKRVAEQKPDLIVLDVYMPGYSGLEVCQRLKDSPETAEIPILLTVGKLEPFKPEEARRVKAEAYIIKPFEASELLSAMTRLEDQMVPGTRKSDSNGDPETGWKSRLRFPSKKKKEELEPLLDEDFVGGPAFRDFRRGRSRGRGASAGANKTVPNAEAPVAPDIPRDITPEELDALSALAAKLDGEAPAAETVARTEKPAELPEASPAASETKEEFSVAAPVVEEAIAEIPVVQVEAADAAKEDRQPAAEASAVEPAPVVEEAKQPEPVPVRVETLAEQEPAPMDREDEPGFATAPAVEAAPEVRAEVQEAFPASVEVAAAASAAETAQVQATPEESRAGEARTEEEEPATAETTEEAPKVEEAAPVAAAAETQAEPEGPAPSEEELAAALRLLTPSPGADSASIPSHGTLVAAGAILAAEAARSAAGSPRWVAETVAVSPEEAALSLEAEMFKKLAGAFPRAEPEPVQKAELASEATPVAQTRDAATESTAVAEAEGVSVEAPADTIAAAPVEVVETTVNTAEAAAAPTVQDSKPGVEEASPVEEPVPATFADVVGLQEQTPVSAEVGTEPASAAPQVEPEITAVVVSEAAAGEDDMSKERGKSGKSNWHQIRAGAPAAADVVEAAKQAESMTEEAPKAMAAAAAAESTPVPGAAADPSAIASIVDSVLADLRPKIVEEIAKKLAGK
jgi:CheY-like chemotaxis protein